MAIKRGTTSKKNTQSLKKTTPSSSNPQQPSTKVESSPKNQQRLVDPTTKDSDDGNAQNIRPHRLQDYIGQETLKSVLKIGIKAALDRKDPLDHLLLYGPPGLGKTTMSLILAEEMGVNCKITAAPALERPRDITGILVNLKPGDVLFIDEIHRLNRLTEELLYPAMEDYRLDITIGKGQASRTRSIPLPKFTLVGATTKVGSLTSPLRDRFGLIERLRFYEPEELALIIERTAKILDVAITQPGAMEIARRSRGTPRIANRLLRRVRDYQVVHKHENINEEVAAQSLDFYQSNPNPLDWTDRMILETMIHNFNGGPVGLESVAASTGEDAKTIEDVYEPYLLQIGFLHRTHRGRMVTEMARKHLLKTDYF